MPVSVQLQGQAQDEFEEGEDIRALSASHIPLYTSPLHLRKHPHLLPLHAPTDQDQVHPLENEEEWGRGKTQVGEDRSVRTRRP